MKTLSPVFALAALLVAGCYTQLTPVKEESKDDERYSPRRDEYTGDEDQDSNAAAPRYSDRYRRSDDDSYYDEYSSHPRYGAYFSYYYPAYYWPSFAFGAAYYNSWCYGSYWYYDPWICGTPYVFYPWYGFYYPPFYAYHYPYYRFRSSYAVGGGSGGVRRNRDFGSTRGGSGRVFGTGRGINRGGYYPPSGASVDRSHGTNRRGDGSTRSAVARGGRGGSRIVREYHSAREGRSGNRGQEVRERGAREERSGERKDQEVRSTYPRWEVSPPERRGRESGGSDRGGARSIGSHRGSDGARQAPPSSSPPPSHGVDQGRGGNSGGGGGRSGGRR